MIDLDYNNLDFTVKEAVLNLNKINVLTNSSEGGGDLSHGAPDFTYIEARLSLENLAICYKYNFVLDTVYGKYSMDNSLYNGSAFCYGVETGFFLIGMKRNKFSDKDVIQRYKLLIKKLKKQ